MLDIKRIRQYPKEVVCALSRRDPNTNINVLLSLDEQRRELLSQVEALKAKRNDVSKSIPLRKKAGEDVEPLFDEMKEVGIQIKDIDIRLSAIDDNLYSILLSIPNIPNKDIPDGEDDSSNIEIKKHMEPTAFSYQPLAHWDIGTNLGILDFETASKVTGARFTFYRGLGAKLERSLINMMLDVHTQKNGYSEILPPFIANSASLTGTGQLPKFSEDMFHLEDTDYYLIPTAEVPITNMYRDTILDGAQLPIRYAAYSACFRAEAGSAGRDTRGLIRQHQFNKVELVKFVKPEDSYKELEKLLADAESILKLLELPYRVMILCAGDIGFSSAKTYDIEVWMPSYGRYVEISSCSNFEDFQARRASIKFKDEIRTKAEFVHTLNGSGLAIGRTVAAILENYQREDGSVVVPNALRDYMGTDIIK